MTTALLLAISFLFTQPQQTAQTRDPLTKSAVIEGRVTRIGTGEPLPQTKVTLIRSGTGGIAPLLAVTAADGTFTIKDIAPGRYRVFAVRNDFSTLEYGERSSGGPGIMLNLIAGQTLKEVHFQMTPAGLITGRVLTPYGEPLPLVTVDLLQATYDNRGVRRLSRVAGARTDDRGEYRIFWIRAGNYVVRADSPTIPSAEDQLASFQPSSVPSDPARKQAEMPGYYRNTYYPSEGDESRADVVEVRPGTQLSGIDIRMDSQPLFRVRGRVVDPRGLLEKGGDVFLSSPNPQSEFSSLGKWLGDTEFEFQNVAAGSYTVGVAAGNRFSSPFSAPTQGPPPFETAQTLINVSNDVVDIVLQLSPGVLISGQIVSAGAPAAIAGVDRMRVRLESIDDKRLSNLNPPPASVIKGSFTIGSIVPGVYRVTLMNLPEGSYVKSLSLGSTDALVGPVTISERVSDTLRIEISANVGQISGTVMDDEGRPVEAIHAVLIPDGRLRHDLYRDAFSDPDGNFRFKDVAPGSYKIFAWDGVEPNAWFDPDFLKEYDPLGKSLTVPESGTTTIALTPIKRP